MWTEQVAQRLAEAVHKGQVDKAGVPYIGHPARVARSVREAGGSEAQVMSAWLHDVVEDSALTLSDLETFGCPAEAVKIVEALTHWKGEADEAYYARLVQTPAAVLVKRADVSDNSNPARLALLAPEVRARLIKKYAQAKIALGMA